MFLYTLGYKHDTILTKTNPVADNRGKHKPKHAMADENIQIIDTHIESFRPTISHYRRAHAAWRRELQPKLTVKMMHGYSKGTHPKAKCSEDTYRRRVKMKNISFAKLGRRNVKSAKQTNTMSVRLVFSLKKI